MSKPGNYTAYQQYKPLDNGTTQALQHWSNFYEQKRQNDIAQEQKDKEQEYKVEKDKEKKREEWLKYDSAPATGVKNYDIFAANSLALGQKELFKSVEEYEKLPKGDPRKLQLEFKIARLQKLPSDFKNLTTPTLKIAQDYYANPDKWVRDPAIDNFLSNLDNAEFTTNDIGESGIIVKDKKDPSKTRVITLQEAMSDGGIVKLTPKFDYDKFVKDNAKILNEKPHSKTERDPETGYLITTEGYDEPSIQQIARSLFIDGEGNPTEYANSFLAQKGIYNYDPKAEQKIPIGIAENKTVGPENEKPKTKLDELVDQFIADLTPRLVDKQGLKTNTNNIQQQKADTDRIYKMGKLAQGQQANDTKIAVETGKGNIKKPITKKSFTYGGKDKNGRDIFGIVENNLIIENPKENTQDVVQGITINPDNPKDIIVNGYTKSKDEDKVEQRTPFTYNSSDNPEEVLRFTSEAKMNIRQMHQTLMGVAGLKPPKKEKPSANKPKPKPNATTKNKTYGGVDANGNIIWK